MKKEVLTAASWYGPVFLAGILLITGMLAPQIWDSQNTVSQFRIEGTGLAKIAARPDSATFEVAAVASLASSAKDATAKIGDKIDKFAAYLSELKGVTYSNTPIQISHDVVQVGKKYAKSFEANQRLKITVTDFTQIQSIIDKAVDFGFSEIGTVRYSLEKDDKYRREARQKALDLARVNAEEVAKQLGVTLDKIIDYYESKEDYSGDDDLEEIINEMDGNVARENQKNLFVSHRVTLHFSQGKGK